MATPAHDHDAPAAAPAPAPATAPARQARWPMRVLRSLAWFGHLLPGIALALLLACAAAGWIWSGRDGSLPQALGWAQSWLGSATSASGRLLVQGAQGSLRGGGTVGQLRWTRQGLDVRIDGLTLRWTGRQLVDALLLRRLQVRTLAIDRLQIDDQRAPAAGEPLSSIDLPLPISLDWSVRQLQMSGAQNLLIEGLRGHYDYGPVTGEERQRWSPAERGAVIDAHRLRIDEVRWARGRYQLKAVLGAQAPMPLFAQAEGTVSTPVPGGNTLDLRASAQVGGHLSGPDATLDLQAHVAPSDQPGTPTLTAVAQVRPGAEQPLHSAQATALALDLSALWPQAPQTQLFGELSVVPEASGWRGQVDLRNTRSGPWDQQRLPLDRLRGSVTLQDAIWTLSDLQASVGRAQIGGSGRYSPAVGGSAGDWAGELKVSSLELAQLWSTLSASPIDLEARASQQARPGDLVILSARAQASRGTTNRTAPGLRELQLQGSWSASKRELRLDQALLDIWQARANLQGTLSLPAMRFSGTGTWALPGTQGRFDGTLAATEGGGDLDLRVQDASELTAWIGDLQALPLVGPALRQALTSLPWPSDGRLDGRASLQAQWRGGLASLGYPAPKGPTQAAVPLEGSMSFDAPSLSASIPGRASPLWSVSQLQLTADGNPANLSLKLSGQAAQDAWRVNLQTQGTALRLWPLPATGAAPAQIRIETLRLMASDGRRSDRVTEWNLQSLQPVQLELQRAGDGLFVQAGPGQLRLQPQLRGSGRAAAVELSPLNLAWQQLDWQNETLRTSGRLNELHLAWLDVLGQAPDALTGPLTQAGVGGNLVFDGTWDLQLPMGTTNELPQLNAQLQRRGGDLTLLTDGSAGPTSAGINEASLSLSTQDQVVRARMRWNSERMGQASADIETRLSSGSVADAPLLERWWPASAPVSGQLSARLPQVGVWSALAPPGWRMRGTLEANATVDGTRGAPGWSGTLQADQLALRSAVDGLAFSDGVLRANLSGEHITIERFELRSPLGGSVTASGDARWQTVDGQKRPLIELRVNADKLRVTDRADRRLVLSGQVSSKLIGTDLTVRGQLKTDSALFALPDESTPSLSSDVVVRGGRNLPQGTSTVAQVKPDVSVDLDLGPQFEVRGRGLQARLTGQLTVRSTPALPTPRVFGTVRTASGSYRAYGQQLSIQTGELIFNGPYDDPALNVLAMRPQARDSEQTVGVQINGTAQAPRVRLVSTPELPDAEKLAYLVLGRPATGAGAEAAILQQAALALLAGNDSALNGGLAGALGLDEIAYQGESVDTDGSTRAATVTLGKRLSSRLYLTYETGLAGAMGTVSVFYDITRRFTLRARAGEENALDLIFTLQYD